MGPEGHSRSQDAECRFGGVVLDALGRVAFLVTFLFHIVFTTRVFAAFGTKFNECTVGSITKVRFNIQRVFVAPCLLSEIFI